MGKQFRQKQSCPDILPGFCECSGVADQWHASTIIRVEPFIIAIGFLLTPVVTANAKADGAGRLLTATTVYLPCRSSTAAMKFLP